MLLRSSSTPILGSLLTCISDSPNHHNHHNNHHNHHSSDFNSPKHQPPIKLSLHQTTPLNLFTPSPSTHKSNSSHADFTPEKRTKTGGFRRVQSEGNLNELLSDSFTTIEELNPHNSVPNKFSHKPHCSVLESIPSRYEGDDEEEEESEKVECENVGSEMNVALDKNNEEYVVELKMDPAAGLGVVTGGFGGGGGRQGTATGGDAGDWENVEEYYRRMMEENPGNPLFLSNYAQFLHKSKDLGKAEEYYFQAMLIDPGDGEILSKYAQLTWELHRDQERASTYFQRAIHAAPQDSHVLAAYAGFLWEADEEEADNDIVCSNNVIHHDGALATS